MNSHFVFYLISFLFPSCLYFLGLALYFYLAFLFELKPYFIFYQTFILNLIFSKNSNKKPGFLLVFFTFSLLLDILCQRFRRLLFLFLRLLLAYLVCWFYSLLSYQQHPCPRLPCQNQHIGRLGVGYLGAL